jgi:hypothetical protein
MASFSSRLWNTVTGAFMRRDTTDLSRTVTTGWLQLLGADVDPATGSSRQTDWQRLRAEASGISDRSTEQDPTETANSRSS